MSFDLNYFGEVSVAALDPRYGEQITMCRFDSHNEVLWTGTESGFVYTLQIPTLERYASWRAHPGQQHIVDMAVLGDGMLSVCATHLAMHNCGGVPRASIAAPEDDELHCCAVYPGGRTRGMVGLGSGGLVVYDLATGQLSSQIEGSGDSVVALASPLDRGMVAAGTGNGRICLLDPRSAKMVEWGMLAHAGGLTALDGRGDLLASCGLTLRMGQVVVDNMVKVYDIRSGLRPLSVLPSSSPSLLRFHPLQTGCLLVGTPSGLVSVVDAQGGSLISSFQVQTGGEALTAMDIAPSGDAFAFCSASYTHLWSTSPSPCVHNPPEALEVPPYLPPKPALARREEESFAAVQQYYCGDKRLLSDVEPTLPIRVGLPPRVLDASIAAMVKQAGFQGHVPNPQYRRGQPHGVATAAVAPLRNTRLQLRAQKQDAAAAKAERVKQRAAAGGVILPERYRRTEIRVQAGAKFEEFDLATFNSTHFAGLENNLPNCYSNALLQALYFIPAFRELVLSRPPEPGLEFCLADEMSFLFRMLASGQGIPCQAANLLRALKQIPEAGALGLLEGAVGWEGWGGQKGEGKREGALGRRIASLSRFLLDHLSKEATTATKSKGAAAGASKHGDAARQVFALTYRQRTQCIHGAAAQKLRESYSFQVDLHFPPPPKGRPTRPFTAEEGRTSRPSTPPPALTPPPENRPSFSQLLQKSMAAENETRAWFDEQRGYQLVRQSQVPLSLPLALVVNTAIQDPSDVQWMHPLPPATPASSPSGPPGPPQPQDGPPWVPWALSIESRSDSWEVLVREGGAVEDLLLDAPPPKGVARAVYGLAGVVCHVRDLDDAEAGAEGHILAHIKVPQPYVTEQHHQNLASSQPHHEELYSYLPLDLDTPTPPPRPPRPAHAISPVPSALPSPSGGPPSAPFNPPRPDHPPTRTATTSIFAHADPSSPSTPTLVHPSGPPDLSGGDAQWQLRSEGSGALGSERGGASGGRWMVFNDFTIQPCAAEEVLQLYAAQKLPCLLYYTQVDDPHREDDAPLKPPVPVMTPPAFHTLCSSPPLQGRPPRPPPFVPLDAATETPRQGMLLAIDAEFVALSAPEKVLGEHGEDIQLKQSMLSLARVSVVRGEGPRSGLPCIDDYVRSVEPIYDYLTRFSGLQPGDLDPGSSSRHLVTLKAAYLKLRYLVDAGCCFVGHGLKKDFRIINIIVPPHQILDTVELWNLPRQRKLSLRFLASYLLGASIQGVTHDSIEDARTSLALYHLYLDLRAEGTFEEKLHEVYQWGKMYGWEPVMHVDGLPTPIPA